MLKEFSLKFYQKVALLALMLSFSMPAMASDPRGLIILLANFAEYASLIITSLILFLILLTKITQVKKIIVSILITLIMMINVFSIYLQISILIDTSELLSLGIEAILFVIGYLLLVGLVIYLFRRILHSETIKTDG